jgi:hypothetical protein
VLSSAQCPVHFIAVEGPCCANTLQRVLRNCQAACVLPSLSQQGAGYAVRLHDVHAAIVLLCRLQQSWRSD